MKKRLLIAIIPVAVLLTGPLVVPLFVPWSAINNRVQEINIRTGQARYSRHLWCLRVSQKVEDTILSRVLGGESVNATDIAPWHRVNTFSLGLHYSPHHRFHGAFYQASEIELFFEILQPDAERKKQIIRDLLGLWQTTGSYFGARSYIRSLSEEAGKVLEQKYPEFSPKLGTSSSGEAPERTR